jgi:hypothetical protein
LPLALLLLANLLALTSLAQAGPPDPVWVDGCYDGGDLDGVIFAAMSLVAAQDTSPLPEPPLIAVETLPRAQPAAHLERCPHNEPGLSQNLACSARVNRSPPAR